MQIRKTDIIVSMLLWKNTSLWYEGCRQYQRTAWGTCCSLTCSLIQHAFGHVGTATELHYAAPPPLRAERQGTEALIRVSVS